MTSLEKKSTFIEENKNRVFVLIDKKERFYFTYNAEQFYDVLEAFIKNKITIWIDTIQGYTEVWQALCSTRKLRKVLNNATSLEEKLNRISIGIIANCLLSIIWLVLEFIDYADTGEKIQVGTIMWVVLSIYILIKKLGGSYD